MDRLKFLAFVLLLVACSMFFYHLGVSNGYRSAAAGRRETTDVDDRETQMEEMAREMLAQMQANPDIDSGSMAALAAPAAADCPPAVGPTAKTPSAGATSGGPNSAVNSVHSTPSPVPESSPDCHGKP